MALVVMQPHTLYICVRELQASMNSRVQRLFINQFNIKDYEISESYFSYPAY